MASRRSRSARPAMRRSAVRGGWAVLALALLSPLHPLGERLFTAHMIEHELLMAVAAPLLALSRPLAALLWGLPPSWRKELARAGHAAPVAAVWKFAQPSVVGNPAAWRRDLALACPGTVRGGAGARHPALSPARELPWQWPAVLVGAAAAFPAKVDLWRCRDASLLHRPAYRPLGRAVGAGAASLVPGQCRRPELWGLSPLEDQQLAGLVMWVPAGLVYAGAALVLAALWIRTSGGRWRRRACMPSSTPRLPPRAWRAWPLFMAGDRRPMVAAAGRAHRGPVLA